MKSLRHGPEVGAAIDEPLDVARRRGYKGLVSVGNVFFWVKLIALIARMRVRVLLSIIVAFKEGLDFIEKTHCET